MTAEAVDTHSRPTNPETASGGNLGAQAEPHPNLQELSPDRPPRPVEAHAESKTPRPRGFAAMDRSLVSDIARKGGKAAHSAGTAHQFTSEEARVAGQKGGRATHAKRRKLSESRASAPSARQDTTKTRP